MADEFDPADYLRGFLDPEGRARAMLAGGWAGHPDLDAVEAGTANPAGGDYQRILASQRKRTVPAPKKALRRMNLKGSPAGIWRAVVEPMPAAVVASAEPAAGTEMCELQGSAIGEVGQTETTKMEVQQAPLEARRRSPARGSLEEAIGRYLYENQGTIWPHIKGKDAKPKWYRPAGAVVAESENPFRPKTRAARSSDLTEDEAVRLYNAIAFAMWQHGAVMNAHVVIWGDGFACTNMSAQRESCRNT